MPFGAVRSIEFAGSVTGTFIEFPVPIPLKITLTVLSSVLSPVNVTSFSFSYNAVPLCKFPSFETVAETVSPSLLSASIFTDTALFTAFCAPVVSSVVKPFWSARRYVKRYDAILLSLLSAKFMSDASAV